MMRHQGNQQHGGVDPETVASLPVGAGSFVPPDALLVTHDGTWHLRLDVPVRRAPDARSTLHVTRTPNGYRVDVTYCNHRWEPQELPAAAHVAVAQMVYGDEFLSERDFGGSQLPDHCVG
jgi:hypothetical protein